MGTLKIRQFRYLSDNMAYLIWTGKSAIAIDPGAVDDLLAFVRSNNLKIEYIVNTHSHSDHTVGNGQMMALSDADFIDNITLRHDGFLKLDNKRIEVWHTPGHSEDSICFLCASRGGLDGHNHRDLVFLIES